MAQEATKKSGENGKLSGKLGIRGSPNREKLITDKHVKNFPSFFARVCACCAETKVLAWSMDHVVCHDLSVIRRSRTQKLNILNSG